MNAVTKHEGEHAVQLPVDPMISMIERVMLNPAADLDKLERMLALKRDHDRDNARVSFSRALSAARATIPPIIKDATVHFESKKSGDVTHYRHETLAGIAKVIDPILSQHGLSYRFRTEQGNGGVKVTCIIAHAEGHSEETSLMCSPDGSGSKNPFQAVGSAVTYLQRYTLKAALGLSAEIDDDGQSAAPRPTERREERQERATEQRQQAPKHEQVAEQMIAAIRKVGAIEVEGNEGFRRDFPRLKAAAPEIAARVEVEIANWHEANRARTGEIIDDEIPY